jgi:hypothetical protein
VPSGSLDAEKEISKVSSAWVSDAQKNVALCGARVFYQASPGLAHVIAEGTNLFDVLITDL